MTDNKIKSMTKKEIKDLAKEMLVQMNITPLDVDVAMDDQSLDILSAKIEQDLYH